MSKHKYTDLTAKELRDIGAVMQVYAEKCEEMAVKLGDSTETTNGIVTIHKGLFTLHNLIAKMLGRLAVTEPKHVDVSKWDHRKKRSAKSQAVEIVTGTKAARLKSKTKGN